MRHDHFSAVDAPPATTLAELVGAFSFALDLTEGQPAGHCVRSCWIGSHVAHEIGLGAAECGDVYYTILLKDLGCSSNAARICELYAADDRAFKQGYKTVGTSLASTLHFVFSRTARHKPFSERATAIGNILKNGDGIAQEMILGRCTRGSDIARTLQFPDSVCEGIFRLDEHWDGSGRPGRLEGAATPLGARIALLAQVADVFHGHAGRQAAIDEVARRSGSWLDPELCEAFAQVATSDSFWRGLTSPLIEARLLQFAPIDRTIVVDDDYLDCIAAAFGQVIDAKSPFTAGHSGRVGDLAGALGREMGVGAERLRWLRRAALLHDVGKLGVSNAILDKPGSLDEREWESMRSHAAHTQEILGRIGPLTDIAPIAAAHHERLDGAGYPLGLAGASICRETRIITLCDFYDALTSERPYRSALSVEQSLAIMEAEIGKAIDADGFEALKASIGA